MRPTTSALLGAVLALTLLAGGAGLPDRPGGRAEGREAQRAASDATPAAARPARDTRPDVVLVLMDDFSLDLLATMPEAQRMRREGADFRRAHVVDSLCCPSRAALFTGQAPHQTGVLTNTPQDPRRPIGGYAAYVAHGNQQRAFNVALQDSGYTTGFVGKFMNGYDVEHRDGRLRPPPVVPGWDDFRAVLGGGYPHWGFRSTYSRPDGSLGLELEPKPPRSAPPEVLDRHYATTVIGDRAVDFVRAHRDDEEPYFLEVATYAPHAQMRQAYPGNPTFPSAFADRAPRGRPLGGNCGTRPCRDLSLRDLPGYDDDPADNAPTYLRRGGRTTPAPAWNRGERLGEGRALRNYRDRARMVQSVDRMLARLRAEVGPDAYVVLTSDNGYHLGQHRLGGGKGTAYDHDTRVPLLVTGPGVVPGPREQVVSSLDLAPTFEQLAGLRPAAYRSGSSLTEVLRRPDARGGRFAFMEHTYGESQPGEVDADTAVGGDLESVPSYVAVRSRRGLLVRLDLDPSWRGTDHAWELYRYDRPWEDRNVFATDHRRPWARELMRRLEAWDGCVPSACRALTR